MDKPSKCNGKTPTHVDAKDEISGFLENRLARFKHPKEYIFVEQLPKSGTGKSNDRRCMGGTEPNSPVAEIDDSTQLTQ
jgi:acyl-CoA synthetase (AMP-forming)/AMP-acid ligase II